MTKARCPKEEYCMKNKIPKCMFEKECRNDYKKVCKFNMKLVNGLKFEILKMENI